LNEPSDRASVSDRRRAPSLLPALLVFALGVAGTFALWRTIQRWQDAELEANAVAVASLLAQVIEAQIDDHDLDALRRWADLSERDPDSSASWRSNAELFLANYPSFGAILRVDDRGRPSDAAGETEARDALRGLVPETSAHSPDVSVGPIRLADGRVAFGVPIPVRTATKEPHVIFALLEPAVALRRLLEHGAAGYSVRVLCQSEELFRAVPGGFEPRPDQFWKNAEVALRMSPPWTVAVHPTAMLVGGAHQGPGIVALIAGLMISALVALLVHVSRVARARGLSLVRVDADLRESIGETEREETEVRELRGTFETRVTQRTATLQETIGDLETFNYSVAHDLRSPMGAVINFAGILEHDYGASLDANAREYLGRISASAQGAVALMNGLLAFSNSGREELHMRQVDMRDLVEGVRDDLAAEKPDAASAVQIGALPRAYADSSMMRRVFTNLISNALKFSREAPAQVEVGGYAQANELIYYVRDQGVGFDMRYAHKLFGVFERLHSRGEFEGHGVGLAIVSRLVRRHGGRIWAQSVLGKGATFFFSLPTRGSRDVRGDGTTQV
jgi:signal transduction histidine kinase